MAVAVYMKSDSGDSYLYLWDRYDHDKIKNHLTEEMKMFYPLAEYLISVCGSDVDNHHKVKNIMTEIHDLSWEI